MNPTATTNTKTSYPQDQTGGLTAVQRAFLWCIGPHNVIPALARSGAGIDELIPPADDRHRSHGGPIQESAIACEHGWMPSDETGYRRYYSWHSNGARLELAGLDYDRKVLAAVTRQQLRTYARSLPYELVSQLRAVDLAAIRTRIFTCELGTFDAEARQHADQLLAQALDLELPGTERDYPPWTQMELW